jgi:outer membrane lipoprotein-sorting protein
MTLSIKSTAKFCGLSFLIVLIAVFSAYADTTTTVSPLLSLLRKNYNPETPLSAKFSLTIYWSVREKEEKKKGTIMLAPDDRFRITVGSEMFVSNGETFWQYSPKTNQVVVKRLADVDRTALPSRILDRSIAEYPFREVERKKDLVQLAWKSDSTGAPYSHIVVWVQEEAGTISRCVMTDRNDNTFTYVFSATTFGKNISKETFEFETPKNARIVDMRK